jgi:hypothetical protein
MFERMSECITECNRCGCREFCVVETLEWRGVIDDTGLLGCTNASNEIEHIRCADCHDSYSEESFGEIDFN